jgi:putative flippase GtrA
MKLPDPRNSKFAKFAIVGALGFGVDYSCLRLFMWAGLGALIGRALSIPIANVFTWLLNRSWSFGRSQLPWYRELFNYALVAGLAALVNYCSFAAIVSLVPDISPLIATAVATAISMLFSFAGFGNFVFRR